MQTRTKSGVDIGDTAKISLQLDKKPRTQPVPKKLSAFSKNKKAKLAFEMLAPSRRVEILRYLNAMKTRESLDRNVRKVVAHLTGHKTTGLHHLLDGRR